MIVFLMMIAERTYASSSGSTFCVGVNVQGTDDRTLDSSLECTFAAVEPASSSSSSSEGSQEQGQGEDQDGEDEDVPEEPPQGGRRGGPSKENADKTAPIVNFIERTFIRPIFRPDAKPAAPETPTEGQVVPEVIDLNDASFLRRPIGIFHYRLRLWPPHLLRYEDPSFLFDSSNARNRQRFESGVHGAWSAIELLRFSSPSERSREFWETFGYVQVDGPSALMALHPSTIVNGSPAASDGSHSLLGSALLVSGAEYLRANPVDLILWLLMIAMIAGMAALRHARKR
jgi:hypothetical protein